MSRDRSNLRPEHLKQRHALSPYIGRTFRGCVVRTIRRGETIFADGAITARTRQETSCGLLYTRNVMHHFGHTRSAHRPDHLLQTPDTFVRAPLPGMQKATAIVHVAPAMGAQFTQYTAEFEAGGLLRLPPRSDSSIVLEGEMEVNGVALPHGDFAYFPPEHAAHGLRQSRRARCNYRKAISLAAGRFRSSVLFGPRKRHRPPKPLMGDDALEVRALVPADPSFDFAVNTMTYLPGAALPNGGDPCHGTRA